ncbi:MAG: ASKHA domain-containing protein, partial [Promethearchaeota archaeon]
NISGTRYFTIFLVDTKLKGWQSVNGVWSLWNMPPVTVVFEPDGRHARAKRDESLFAIARRVGINIRSDCGGQGSCGKCRILIRPASAVTPITTAEKTHLTSKELRKGIRLACQARVKGSRELRVILLPESRPTRRRLQIEGISKPVSLRSSIHSLLLRIPPVDPDNPVPDDERLTKELGKIEDKYAQKSWRIPIVVHRTLPEVLRRASGHVTVIFQKPRTILDVIAGDAQENIFGVAIDIGTSKLVACLHSLVSGKCIAAAGIENPQISYGEDIMSRLSYAGADSANRRELQHLVCEGVNQLLQMLANQSGISSKNIYEIVVAGNTAMTSLFLGVDTTFLAFGPFVLPFRGPLNIPASHLGLSLPSHVNVHILPNVAGYVGADAVADILATQLNRRRKISLLIDIGTNTEVVFGNRDGLAACSCAAGPAFEGAHIEHGMKAVTGAIERLRINPNTLDVEFATVDDAIPIGICGSGVLDTVAQLAEAGLITHQGKFTKAASPRLQQSNGGRKFILVKGAASKNQPTITISEYDISQLLLAKAAVQTGYEILLSQKQLTPDDIDHVYIAGAFGRYLNPVSAQRIGLIPHVPVNRVTFAGNTALAGASMALLSLPARRQATKIARIIHHIDLARHPAFNQTYTASLFLPSK